MRFIARPYGLRCLLYGIGSIATQFEFPIYLIKIKYFFGVIFAIIKYCCIFAPSKWDKVIWWIHLRARIHASHAWHRGSNPLSTTQNRQLRLSVFFVLYWVWLYAELTITSSVCFRLIIILSKLNDINLKTSSLRLLLCISYNTNDSVVNSALRTEEGLSRYLIKDSADHRSSNKSSQYRLNPTFREQCPTHCHKFESLKLMA